jgi:glycine/D-amino acid oxidase-like deaminating enzyme
LPSSKARRSGSLRPKRRDLRTGRSIWEELSPPPAVSRASGASIEADVVVVGAGVSGALAAYFLAEAGLRVAIVDRRGLLRGSTVASTALLQFELDMPLTELIRKIGRADAERGWRRSARSVRDLGRLVQRLGIACGWEARDALYLCGNRLDRDGLAREAAARQRIGLESRLVEGDELRRRYGIARGAGLLSPGGGECDPVRLAGGLIRRAIARGARLYAPVEITRVDAFGRGVRARTKSGMSVRADHLVFATGYEIPRRIPAAGHRITATWAIATAPQPERLWPSRCLVWEAAQPYLYIRTTSDGRVLAGGEDQAVKNSRERDAVIPKKTRLLERKLHKLLPKIDARTEFAWAGTFGESETSLPTIGPVPGMPGCYAILGYGGNGITFSLVAAQILRSCICGPPDRDADLFSFETKRRLAARRRS